MNTMCQWTFTYTPEGEEPLGFRFVSFGEDDAEAKTTSYVHWLVLMLKNGYAPPGLVD